MATRIPDAGKDWINTVPDSAGATIPGDLEADTDPDTHFLTLRVPLAYPHQQWQDTNMDAGESFVNPTEWKKPDNLSYQEVLTEVTSLLKHAELSARRVVEGKMTGNIQDVHQTNMHAILWAAHISGVMKKELAASPEYSELSKKFDGLVPERYIGDEGYDRLLKDLDVESRDPKEPEAYGPERVAYNIHRYLQQAIRFRNARGRLGLCEQDRNRAAQKSLDQALGAIKMQLSNEHVRALLPNILKPGSQKIDLGYIAQKYADTPLPSPLAQGSSAYTPDDPRNG